ncbi:MAG: transposase [Oleispira sp.]|nr:transposase [Oleispira sp.]
MNQWYSVQELLSVGTLPSSVKGMLKKSEAERWQSRARSGRGGGNEFYFDSLPKETQRALRISYAKKAVAKARQTKTFQEIAAAEEARQLCNEQGLIRYQALSKNQKKKVDAISQVMLAARLFHENSGLTKKPAYIEFSRLYKADEITVEPWVRDVQKACSQSSLEAWELKSRSIGIDALAGDSGKGRRNTGAIDTQSDLKDYILAVVVDKPHIKMTTLNKAVKAQFANTDITLVSLRTLERWVNKWKQDNASVFTNIINPEEWKNKFMVAMGSASEEVIELNQLWEFDSTPADLMLTDGRFSIIGVIDVGTRRTHFVVSRTSDSKGVAQVIREAILKWGVPITAKTDNGADYKSVWIQHALKALGIHQQFCPPFSGWKKPHIERVFRTFSHDIAELLPGYIGHNVSERQAIEARKSFSDRLFKKDQIIDVEMSSEQLQEFCDRWLNSEYHTRIHSGLKCSPNEMAARYTDKIKTISDERVLDILLSEPAGTRTVKKKGISLNGFTFIHPELAALVGHEVSTFFHAKDIGQIYVYNMAGEYVCTAEDPEATGVDRIEVAYKAKEIQKEAVQEEKRRLKASSKKLTKKNIAMQILEHSEAEELARKVSYFPRPEVEYTSEGLEAAQAALADADLKNGLKDVKASLNTPNSRAPLQLAPVIKPDFNLGLQPPRDLAERYKFWQTTNQKIEDGVSTEEERKWAGIFKHSSAFSAGKELLEMRESDTPLTINR